MSLWRNQLRMAALMDRYENLPMDFCDESLLYLAAALKEHRITTTDRSDFSVNRLPN